MATNKPTPLPSKPQPTSGISPPDTKSLTLRIETLEKFIRDQFDEKNQWNSLVRGWVDKKVKIRLMDGEWFKGSLRWVDRYTICLEDDDKVPAVIHKAAIAIITPDLS